MNQDVLEMAQSHLVNVEQALANLHKQKDELDKEIVKVTDYLKKGKDDYILAIALITILVARCSIDSMLAQFVLASVPRGRPTATAL